MHLVRSHLARSFAKYVAQTVNQLPLSVLVRSCAPQEEHKAAAEAIRSHLVDFLVENKVDMEQNPVLFDWEGNSKRTWPQSHSYPVLGTYAHPDAAVLSPFTCAFEFDREGAISDFKAALLKAATHVLSGAYEAALLVYVLKPGSSPTTYTEDKSVHTGRILQMLETSGLVISFIST